MQRFDIFLPATVAYYNWFRITDWMNDYIGRGGKCSCPCDNVYDLLFELEHSPIQFIIFGDVAAVEFKLRFG